MLVVSPDRRRIGGLVEIAPLFYCRTRSKRSTGVRPYLPLELPGRNIYIREGLLHLPQPDDPAVCGTKSCATAITALRRKACTTIRSSGAPSGPARIWPALAQRYSNEWHVQHLVDPRSVVPESVMPTYPFLAAREVRVNDIADHLAANKAVGVPYTDEMLAEAKADLITQATVDADIDALLQRYPKAQTGDFDGDPGRVTEMDALVAYLQMLGTLVDFTQYQAEENYR